MPYLVLVFIEFISQDFLAFIEKLVVLSDQASGKLPSPRIKMYQLDYRHWWCLKMACLAQWIRDPRWGREIRKAILYPLTTYLMLLTQCSLYHLNLHPGQLFKFPKAPTVWGGFSTEIGSSASFYDDRTHASLIALWTKTFDYMFKKHHVAIRIT